MVKKFLKSIVTSLALVLALVFTAGAQVREAPVNFYKIDNLPDSLKENANSIVRYSYDEIFIKGPGKATVKHQSYVTILNEKGDRDAIFELLYNRKYDNYSHIEVIAYDQDGKILKKYHKSDMYDGMAGSNEELAGDSRFLALRHAIASYPTTIEIDYEETMNSFWYINMPEWVIQERFEQSVENSKVKVIVDSAAGFRYSYKNIKLKPSISWENGLQTYVWQVSNLKAIKNEDNAKAWTQLPEVRFIEGKFDSYGYPGEMTSWQTYGQWIYNLNKDVCTLTPQRAEQIRKMTDSIKSDRAKAKFLYEYMQKSMRYVSINLGIGGYKPFDANFVDQKKYGDCKALSNYMYALLKAVNIPSNWVVIYRGKNGQPADINFPYNSFNHEILVIPFKNDTTFLECTGNNQPFGTLDESTLNRNGLMITEDGGKLINTPRSQAKYNQFNSDVYIQLQPDGSAKAQVNVSATGEYRLLFLELEGVKMDEQKQFWLRNINIKQPDVFDYKPGKDTVFTKHIQLNLEYDKFCDIMAGDKQFYRPIVFPISNFTAPATDKRNSDFFIDFPLQKSCITTIDLPPGFEVETLPSNTSIKFSYGTFDASYVYNKDKNQVVGTAKFVLNNQVIPAIKYNEMQEYMDNVARAQNKKLVIKKKA